MLRAGAHWAGIAGPSVRRLVHFSTVTAYGAHADNTIAARLCENVPLRERDYLYGSHKCEIEGLLEQACAAADRSPHVVVLRCASIRLVISATTLTVDSSR